MGSYRFIFAFSTSLLIQSLTIWLCRMDGWRSCRLENGCDYLCSNLDLIVNTISVLSVKELAEEELNDGKAAGTDEKYSLIDAGKLYLPISIM